MRVCGYRDENGEYPCDTQIDLEFDQCREHESLTHSEIIKDVRARLKVAVDNVETLRNSAVRYLDAEDMAAKRTCDKELLSTLEKIKAK